MLPEASGGLAQTAVSPAGKGLGERRAPSRLFFSGCSIHPGRLASVRRLGQALHPRQGRLPGQRRRGGLQIHAMKNHSVSGFWPSWDLKRSFLEERE